MKSKKNLYLIGTTFFGALGFALGSFVHFQAYNHPSDFRQIFPSLLWWIGPLLFLIGIGLFGGIGLGILLKNRKKMLLLMLIGAAFYFVQNICTFTIFDRDIFISQLVFAPLTGAIFSLVYNNWKITRNFIIASTLTIFSIFLLYKSIWAYMDPSGELFNANPILFYQTRDFLALFPYFGLVLLGGIFGYLNGKIELKQKQSDLTS
jgi:hypothetical protein